MKLVYDEEKIIEVTKEFSFDSAHYLKEYDGLCSNLHGHTYKLLVTFEGYCDSIGMVIDFNVIKDLVKREVVNRLDHKNINLVLPFNPTAENMVCWIYDVLSQKVDCNTVWVKSVTLYETPTSKARYERR